MTDEERLADIKERFGPESVRVGDPPTAADVEVLLRHVLRLQEAVWELEQVVNDLEEERQDFIIELEKYSD